jgi:hypothetical protein
MKQPSTFTRVSTAAVTTLFLALGFLVSSGLLVPLLIIVLLASLGRRHARRSPGAGNSRGRAT